MEARCRGSGQRNKLKSEPTKQGGSRGERGKTSARAKKGRADQKKKVRTRTWFDVVKGLKEDELETNNLDRGKVTSKSIVEAEVRRTTQVEVR